MTNAICEQACCSELPQIYPVDTFNLQCVCVCVCVRVCVIRGANSGESKVLKRDDRREMRRPVQSFEEP